MWPYKEDVTTLQSVSRLLIVAIALIVLICRCISQLAPIDLLSSSPGVVVAQAIEYRPLEALQGEERLSNGAQLFRVRGGKAAPLVSGFAATSDADVSFDGKSVLFAGRKTDVDPWQIWELNLGDNSVRRVTTVEAVCPFFLPGGRIVYARKVGHRYELETAELDGSKPLTLSHILASTIPTAVLQDGRILFEANYPLGTGSTPELFLVYPDGSGVESYRCDHGAARWEGKQLASGDVVFTHGSSLARFTSSLATETPVPAPAADYTGGIAEIGSGEWLLSERAAGEQHYSLKSWNPGTLTNSPTATKKDGAPPTTVFALPDKDIVEPVLIEPRTAPRLHPSQLHDWNYAVLLALDARQSREGVLSGVPSSVHVEAQEADGRIANMGSAPIESDGSFYIKIPAERPIRLSVLDAKGTVIRKEEGFFWTRAGEQRICVGCHTGPERAPDNKIPAVLQRTTIPFDLSKPIGPLTTPQK